MMKGNNLCPLPMYSMPALVSFSCLFRIGSLICIGRARGQLLAEARANQIIVPAASVRLQTNKRCVGGSIIRGCRRGFSEP